MQITEVLEKLKKLQDVLAEKYELEGKINELPKSLDGSKERLERDKQEYLDKNSEFEAEKAKISALKIDLQEAVNNRESGEKGMDSISTHREYEALDKQITEATAKEAEIRKILEKEEKIFAEIDESLKDLREQIEFTQQEVDEANDNINKELDGYRKELDKLKKKEEAITPGIEPEIIFKFQRIIQRNSKGIVAVRGIVCDGCHMILPAQFANEVHKGEDILFCPYCSRILFFEEDEENTANYSQFDDSGSLADYEDEDAEDQDRLDDEDENEEDEDGEMKSMGYDD